MTNNDLQNTTQKTKDRATQTRGLNSGAPVRSSCYSYYKLGG